MNDEASCYCIQQYPTYILSDSVTKSLVEFSRCEDCLIKCRCNCQSTDATPTEVTFYDNEVTTSYSMLTTEKGRLTKN